MRILVVDDEEIMRSALTAFVTGMGHEAIAAGDGEEALAQILRQPPDVLVTDFRMPRLDGVALLAECRRRGLHFPVIFMSADAALVDGEAVALSDCCATLIVKPPRVETFRAALGAAIAREHHADCVHRPSAAPPI